MVVHIIILPKIIGELPWRLERQSVLSSNQKILQKVREEGLSVYKAAQIYNVNYCTIYGWIKKQVEGKDRNLILENNRLKKELDTTFLSACGTYFYTQTV